MKYLLNIFDLDGTLIDSHVAICMAINNMLKDFGLQEQDEKTLSKMIGYPLEDMMSLAGIKDYKKAIETYRHYYFQYIREYQNAFPGIKEMLESHHNKILLAIATNKGRAGTISSLEGAGLEGYFDIMITEDEIKHLKPDPEAFQKILKRFRSEGKFLDREDILMIGDSPVDIDFAYNCGIDSAFAGWGFNRKEDLNRSPTYILTQPQELADINGINEVMELEITVELDLHTYRPRDAAPLVRDYIYSASRKGLKTVRIIHGKGIGVQRRMVQEILKNNAYVKRFYDAPPYIGGLGATIVEIKETKK